MVNRKSWLQNIMSTSNLIECNYGSPTTENEIDKMKMIRKNVEMSKIQTILFNLIVSLKYRNKYIK